MASDDQLRTLARTYAEALFRVGEERGVAEDILQQLEEIVRFGDAHTAFRQAFLSPLASPEQRATGIEHLLRGRADDVLVDFYQVLNRKGRPMLLPAVAEAYRAVFQESRGIVDVRVESAAPLDDVVRERLRQAIRKRLGLEARLLEAVVPELLGGIVVRIRDAKFDTSLKTKLERLRHTLLERGSNEIIRGASSPTEEMR